MKTKKYVCTICGYVHEGELTDDFTCPICGADRSAFVPVEEENAAAAQSEKTDESEKGTLADDELTELTPMEMSIICSNLARGCEKQYMPEQSKSFKLLADFFRSKAGSPVSADIDRIADLIESDLSKGFPEAFSAAKEVNDRGALRSLVWSEKVTKVLSSLMLRYKTQGDKLLENTGVYVCSVCGFVFIGDRPPEICPICKVPAWKFDKIEGRSA